MLKVLVLNDQNTPMEFVASVLQDVFGYTEDQAKRIALQAHLNGQAACGICRSPVDGEAWTSRATAIAQQRGYPLEFSVVSIPLTERVGASIFHAIMKVAPTIDFRIG